jgi:hypothetical protein
MKKVFIGLIIVFYTLNLFAQQPDWIDFNTRKLRYSDREYLSTFLWNDIDKKENAAEKIEQLKLSASSELSSMVRTQINSTTTLQTIEENQQVNEYFKQASTSYTDLTLTGLKYESYHDAKKNKIYVLAYVKRQGLISYYKAELNNKLNKLKVEVEKAKLLESSNNKTEAYKVFSSLNVAISEIESVHSLLITFGVNSTDELDFDRFQNLKSEIQKGIVSLSNSDSKNINDAVYHISHNLGNQIQNKNIPIRLSYFSYQDSRMTSPFSKRLYQSFKKHLVNSEGFKISAAKDSEDKMEYVLKGTYWEEGNNIRISASLVDMKTQQTLAAFDNVLAKNVLESSGIQYKPENFEDAYARMQQFSKDEIIGGGMKAKVWTNHGDENVLYAENDTMNLYVRVNRASYLRVIYYLADGSKVLLLDNYYIDAEKVNKVYEIPDKFVCAPPFGVESLQLLAQTKPFEALSTTEEYGYQFINDDTEEVLRQSRGFKRVQNEDLKAESRLIITTMK